MKNWHILTASSSQKESEILVAYPFVSYSFIPLEPILHKSKVIYAEFVNQSMLHATIDFCELHWPTLNKNTLYFHFHFHFKSSMDGMRSRNICYRISMRKLENDKLGV